MAELWLIRPKMIEKMSELMESQKVVPQPSQASFIEDIWEDLKQMDGSRIAGMGITLEQLKEWLLLRT